MIFLLVVFPVLGCYLTETYLESTAESKRIASISSQIQNLEQAVQVDKQRELILARIAGVIERYNKEIDDSLRRCIADEILQAATKYGNLDVDLICAVITHESGRTWDVEIVSSAGAMGLMQIMPRTGKWLAKLENITWTSPEDILFNPTYNIRMGTRYLSYLLKIYSLEGALAAYNAGPLSADLWVENDKQNSVLYEETQEYIPRVLHLYDKFSPADSSQATMRGF